jgi:hypothetical protein
MSRKNRTVFAHSHAFPFHKKYALLINSYPLFLKIIASIHLTNRCEIKFQPKGSYSVQPLLIKCKCGIILRLNEVIFSLVLILQDCECKKNNSRRNKQCEITVQLCNNHELGKIKRNLQAALCLTE